MNTTSTAADPSSSSSDCAMDDDGAKAQCQSDVTADQKEDATSSSSEFCPLFMDGLPSDFAANPGLAAIASLLEEDGGDDKGTECKKKDPITLQSARPKSGGGKAKKTSSKRSGQSSPYSKEKNSDDWNGKKKASLGEAQLFLNMWKL